MEESPGSNGLRCQVTPGGREPTESATERYRPSAAQAAPVRVKWCGKSAPRRWQHRRHGKPHLEQDQIGKRAVFWPLHVAHMGFRVGRLSCAATRIPEEWLSTTEPGLPADSFLALTRTLTRPKRPRP